MIITLEYRDHLDDGPFAKGIACNCCGQVWTEEETVVPENEDNPVYRAEKVAEKNGWLIHSEKHFHVCEECAKPMIEDSYFYDVKE